MMHAIISKPLSEAAFNGLVAEVKAVKNGQCEP